MVQTQEMTLESFLKEGLSPDVVTKSDLKTMIHSYNEQRGLGSTDEGYVPVSGKKDELVSRVKNLGDQLVETEENNDEETSEEGDEEIHEMAERAQVVERGHKTLQLGQIKQNPLNPREDVDYFDPSLQDKIRREGGLLDALTVRPTGETDDQGREVYYILSGNRRRYNLEHVVWEEFGEDADKYPVECIVRETEGSDSAKQFDEIATMINANEGQLPLSPVGKWKAMESMLANDNVTSQDVAEALDVTPSYISKMRNLRYVDEKILKYVHFGFNAKHFQSNFSPEEMERAGIPFVKRDTPTDEGVETEVLGINFNSALVFADVFKELRDLYGDEKTKNEIRNEIQEFIASSEHPWQYRSDSGEGVISAATHMSTSQFGPWLKDAAKAWGLYPEPEPVKESEAEKEVKAVGEGALELDEGESEPVEEPEDFEDEGLYEDVDEDIAAALAEDLEEGNVSLADDWVEKWADELRMGEARARRAFNDLLDIGVLEVQ